MPSSVAPGSVTVSAFLPARDDRALFVGQTGSGKTRFMEEMALLRRTQAQWPLVVVYDTKGRISWPGFAVYRRLRDLPRHADRHEQRIIYRPIVEELPQINPVPVEIFSRWVYLHKRGILLIVDELYALVEGRGRFPTWFFAALTQGRELHIAVWMGIQRPSLVPLVAFTEANSIFAFRLQEDDDRKRVSQWAGRDLREKLVVLPFHQYYHYRAGTERYTGPWQVTLER